MAADVLPQSAVPAGRPDHASLATRFAVRVIQAGAIATALAATTHRGFDLDRFLIPKELALHVSAFLAACSIPAAAARELRGRGAMLAWAFLLLSLVSTCTASNIWLASRALALSASAVLLLAVARALARRGMGEAVTRGTCVAVIVAVATSLLQTYGVWLSLFSANRAPGGTLGNRNFVAHVAAFGLPLLLLAVFRARRRGSAFVISIGVAAVSAALVLTRSRAAWLAGVVMIVTFVAGLAWSPALRRERSVKSRLVLIVIAALVGGTAALVIPNTLRWRSDNPYLESVAGVVNYEEGSGRGRLVQYERSLRMAASYPLLGVGPGNWPVVYPEFARRNDPSLDPSEPGMTFNPWPSSDWVAFVAERGGVAALALAGSLFLLAVRSWSRLRTGDRTVALQATALISLLGAVTVAGLFDAVLLLALPALLVATATGALSVAPGESEGPQRGGVAQIATVAALIVVSIGGAWRSSSQIAAMELVSRGDGKSLRTAARFDPGSYAARIRLARGRSRDRCVHARAALQLFPQAAAARNVARGCRD